MAMMTKYPWAHVLFSENTIIAVGSTKMIMQAGLKKLKAV